MKRKVVPLRQAATPLRDAILLWVMDPSWMKDEGGDRVDLAESFLMRLYMNRVSAF